MKPAFAIAPIAALQLVSAQVCAAQPACIAPEDLTDTITYAMPLAYDATLTACEAEFSAEGFMKTEGLSFANSFRVKQESAWPAARRVLMTFAAGASSEEGSSDAAMADAISAMPDEALRPFVDALVTQKLTEEIKPDTCDKVERMLTLLSPLPAENVSGLVTLIVELTGVENPSICTTDGEAAAE